MNDWKFSVSSADEAPDTAPILLKGNICENLIKASSLGYDAIEVHTREDEYLDYDKIEETANQYKTKVCMIITGRLNTQGKCSLIDDAPYVSNAAINGLKSYVDMASRLSADIVVGWVKGNIAVGGNRNKCLDRLAKNLDIVSSYAKNKNVKINLEVINRYEVNIFTTAEEIVIFLDKYKIDNCFIHLDTFHMGIDECDPIKAIKLCEGRLGYFHLADNSRMYPGSGQFDFKKIFAALKDINYHGYLGVECLPYPSGEEAAKKAMEFLKTLLHKIKNNK